MMQRMYWWKEALWTCSVILCSTLFESCAKQAQSDINPIQKPIMWSCQYDSLACAKGGWSKGASEFIMTGDSLPFEIWFEPRTDLHIDSIPWPEVSTELPDGMGRLYRFEFTLRPKRVTDENNEEYNMTTETAYPCLFKAYRWSNGWTPIDSSMVGSLLEEKCFKQRILGRPIGFMSGECR